ncbi:MFS transporter [Tichowtungia aerotolerans]|uniref:MFS transporter n=1 Tax=Tichowtungia aerotolerans TaxID=2697043 RepID=A0A6P1M6Q1_9BACT|nr:MFS transporter [Tichowtungia aerotolerans]QHI68274.1 MFS transporter [Tichowtungia aerotolerans]
MFGKKAKEYNPHHIPLLNKIGYGFGAIADNLIMNAFGGLVMPVYNIALFVDPALLGYAIAIPRIFDAFSDPIMGNISDNTRSRWGRRRPYIFSGALLCALLLPVVWMAPVHEDRFVFWWVAILGTLYFTAYTVYIVPWQALGFEMTTDYDERQRLLAWPNYVGLTMSFLLPWLPRLVEVERFGGTVQGAVWVSVGVGLIIILAGLLPTLFGREIAQAEEQEHIGLIKAIMVSASNPSFLIVAFSNVIVLAGLAAFSGMGLYVNIFYIFDGDRAAGLALAGLGGTVYAIAAYFSVMLAVRLGTRLGKKVATQILLGLTMLGAASLLFTLRPDMPYLQLVSTVFVGLGLQGTWMTFFTMVGDVCEEDELKTGLRREGMFSSIGGFSRKMAVAVAAIITGNILKWIGFDAEVAATSGVPENVLGLLKISFVGGQVIVLGLGLLLISFYPITRERALETQRLLKERRGELTEA